VGPRGDAQLPDAQVTRLEWLAQWVVPHADAIAATRPWIRPGTTTVEGCPLRYTARDTAVYAFVRDPLPTVTLADARATPTTDVTTVGGDPLPWIDTPPGIVVDLPTGASGPEPAVIALHQVTAR
jgi:alpha-L-fucosidase